MILSKRYVGGRPLRQKYPPIRHEAGQFIVNTAMDCLIFCLVRGTQNSCMFRELFVHILVHSTVRSDDACYEGNRFDGPEGEGH